MQAPAIVLHGAVLATCAQQLLRGSVAVIASVVPVLLANHRDVALLALILVLQRRAACRLQLLVCGYSELPVARGFKMLAVRTCSCWEGLRVHRTDGVRSHCYRWGAPVAASSEQVHEGSR